LKGLAFRKNYEPQTWKTFMEMTIPNLWSHYWP